MKEVPDVEMAVITCAAMALLVHTPNYLQLMSIQAALKDKFGADIVPDELKSLRVKVKDLILYVMEVKL